MQSDHRGILTTCANSREHLFRQMIRLKMTRNERNLRELLEPKRKITLTDVLKIIKQEGAQHLERRRAKPSRLSYRQRCYWFQTSKVLEGLKLKMYRLRKFGNADTVAESSQP